MSESSPRPIDVHWGGRSGEIAAWLVGDVLVDCGPAVSVERLLEGLGGVEPRVLLLTHIHLDHAGAVGHLVARWPRLEVHVHPRGLPHLADPSRLMSSARRIYGDELDTLWGILEPVPEASLHELEDGSEVEGFLAAHTPGHASHHVSFLRLDGGEAFTGDAAGVRLRASELIVPHAPPPDIDVEAWDASLDTLAAWRPGTLCLPHFGAVGDVAAHLAGMREALHRKAEIARAEDLAGFVAAIESELSTLGDPALAEHYRNASPPEHSWYGFQRYWQKREES